ncbi:uncharacterized protein K02A2.6-like [Pararge aegeria]|nr:uncharacterized protein K02A2.6-like [Pararge aegeria]
MYSRMVWDDSPASRYASTCHPIRQRDTQTCQRCETCAMEASAPPRATPQAWPYNTQPWTRIHIDFLGPYQGKTYLVLIDSSSKWLDLFHMPRTTASSVIRNLRVTFANFGLPLELISDQGPPFTSNEFKEFLTRNGIRQSFSPVYHPQSNGAAENAVKLCKRAIKKAIRDNVDVEAAIQTFLLAYRNSVHLTTGKTPAMLLQRRSLRSRLDLLRGERGLEDAVHTAQKRQMLNARGITRDIECGDSVWVREYGEKNKWAKGVITDRLGSRRFTVGDDNGRLITRHMDQIKPRARLSGVACPTENDSLDKVEREDAILEPTSEMAESEMTASNVAQECDKDGNTETESSLARQTSTTTTSMSSPPRAAEVTDNLPKRERKKVERFGYT